MSEATTATTEPNISELEKNDEEKQQDAGIISIRTAKLLKFRHEIRQLRETILGDFSKEVKECRNACSDAKTLIGELNDDIKQEGSHD
jgi:hypothetical protein